jgi:hypothetical protein
MANYLIVVPRGNAELFDLLSVAFRGHTGFNVVVDRRQPGSGAVEDPPTGDAPAAASRMPLGPDEIVVAERAERADRLATGNEISPLYRHVPVRRRRPRPRRSASQAASGRLESAGRSTSGGASVF